MIISSYTHFSAADTTKYHKFILYDRLKLHCVCAYMGVSVHHIFLIHPSADGHKLVLYLGYCELYMNKRGCGGSLLYTDLNSFEI